MIIGLTGGIGSGKTTVAKIFADNGYNLIDADEISKEVTCSDPVAKKELTEAFGNEILNSDGSVSRRKLGTLAFSSDENLAKINDIVTKRIIEISKARFTEKCVYDAPTLLENHLESLVDIIILVTADEDIRIERVKKRSKYTEEHIKKIIKSQMPEDEKIKLSDIVIYNNGTFEELYAKVTEILNCDKIKC